MIQWNKLTSEEFEKLALTFARFQYQEYKWEPTKLTGDDNHDFFYTERDKEDKEWEGWGEAKHSIHVKKIMSREKWDQTVISGQLANNVRHLMFVTNARIPINYVLRAECLKSPPYEKFEYINNSVLEHWLYEHPEFIPNKLKSSFDYSSKIVKREMRFKFFIIDYFSVSRNILSEPKEFYSDKEYLLFFIFESNYSTQLKISFLPESIIKILPYDIFDLNCININIGITCFKSIIQFKDSGNFLLSLFAYDKLS